MWYGMGNYGINVLKILWFFMGRGILVICLVLSNDEELIYSKYDLGYFINNFLILSFLYKV